MSIKTKSLLMLGTPFMLLLFTGCDTTAERIVQNFQKWHSIEKTVNKKVVFVGEPVTVKIKIANRSPYDINEFWIQRETKKVNHSLCNIKEFSFLEEPAKITPYSPQDIKKLLMQEKTKKVNNQIRGGNEIKCGRLKRRRVKELSYTLVPKSTGILYIPPAKLTKVKVLYEDKAVIIPSHLGYSNSLKIKVIPAGLSVKHIPAKINSVVGQRIDATIAIKNSSPFDVNHFQIVMDYSSDAFVFLKKVPESRRISRGQEIVIPYSIMPVLEGTRTINARIKKIKYDQKRDIISPHWHDVISAELKIEAKPLKLQALYNFDKTKMKLMEHCCAEFHIQNLSDARIDGIKYVFLENGNRLKQLHASSNSNTLSLPPGETRMIKYRYRAIQSGTANPQKVIIKEIKANGCWFTFDNRYLKTGKITPLEISALRLPGYKNPIEHICPDLEKYYNHYALKVTAIALSLLVLIALFRFLTSCFIVEFMFGKMCLNLFMAAALSQTLLLFLTGCVWFWRTLPEPLDLAAILAGSICMCFIFGLFPVKNLALATAISGFVVATSSSLIFCGLQTYQLRDFSNFPVSVSIGLFFLIGWGVNLWIFRSKNNNRRKK